MTLNTHIEWFTLLFPLLTNLHRPVHSVHQDAWTPSHIHIGMNLDNSNSGHFHRELGHLNTHQYPHMNSHHLGSQHHKHTETKIYSRLQTSMLLLEIYCTVILCVRQYLLLFSRHNSGINKPCIYMYYMLGLSWQSSGEYWDIYEMERQVIVKALCTWWWIQ